MTEHRLDIRTMTREEVDIAVDWAAAEGWNPGLHDAGCYYAADPLGFLIGLVDGAPVATISAVQYGDTFGFIGFYIVKPEHRGKGYGVQIWKAAMARMAGRNVGLDGVVERQHNYRQSGFELAYRNVRYEGRGGGDGGEESDTVELSDLSLETVDAYDRPFFPANRSRFLRSWITQPGGCALGIIQGSALEGYGVMRRCRSGYKIGPLFADSPERAERLFEALISRAEAGAPVFLDVPEVNGEAVALVEKRGMSVVFETARMYTGKAPDLPLDRQFGVTSFEIG